MTEQEPDLHGHTSEKLSARMSVFAWVICAALGWALALTSFSTFTGTDENETLTAQIEPSADEAQKMEQILPAAGENTENQ